MLVLKAGILSSVLSTTDRTYFLYEVVVLIIDHLIVTRYWSERAMMADGSSLADISSYVVGITR